MITLQDWMPWYYKIRDYLNISYNDDTKATQILNDLLPPLKINEILDKLKEKIKNREVYVVGCGTSIKVLSNRFQGVVSTNRDNYFILAADGATTALLEINVIPDAIVSDLDGRIEDILFANKKGSVVLIHAHGDNIDKLKKYVPLFSDLIIGTTQVEPKKKVLNFYGFTDGDRAVFFAYYLGAKKIFLIGMDFENIVSKYSKPYFSKDTKATEFKRKKLEIGKMLLNWLQKKSKIKLIFVK